VTKAARVARPRRQRRARLFAPGRREVERQAGGENVPEFALLGAHRMQFGADQSSETVRAKRPRVRDRPAEAFEEMIGELQEVVARTLVRLDDMLGAQRAVGQMGMGVQIAAPEPAGARKRDDAHAGPHSFTRAATL
jgi:hypothetical protein